MAVLRETALRFVISDLGLVEIDTYIAKIA